MIGDKIGAIMAVVVFAAIYLLPLIVASTRNLSSTVAIGVVNVFLGWTIVGWIVALVWALADQETIRCKQERDSYLRAIREGYSPAELQAERIAQVRMPCPHCAELVKRAAKVCPFCRRDIPVSALSTS